MDQATEEQIQDLIIDLKDQLKFTSDDTISDDLITEIKIRETQLKQLIIKNNTI